MGVAVEDAVQEKVIGILARAVDVDGEVAANRSRGALGGGATPGSSRPSSKKLRPSNGRPVICRLSTTPPSAAEPVRSTSATAVTCTVSLRWPGSREISMRHFLVQQQRDLPDLLGVAFPLGLDPVFPRRQVRDGELALRVRERIALPIGLLVNQAHRHAVKRLPPAIGDRAADRLATRRQRNQQAKKSPCPRWVPRRPACQHPPRLLASDLLQT